MAKIPNKRNLVSARVTVCLKGTTKNKFFEEVERTGIDEAKLARRIIANYYNGQEGGKERFF